MRHFGCGCVPISATLCFLLVYNGRQLRECASCPSVFLILCFAIGGMFCDLARSGM